MFWSPRPTSSQRRATAQRRRREAHRVLAQAVEPLESRLLLAGEVFLPGDTIPMDSDLRTILARHSDFDGPLRLVVGEGASGTVRILAGDGYGGFAVIDTLFGSANGNSRADHVLYEDLDGDGYQDVVILNAINGELDVFRGDGYGGFDFPDTFSTGGTATSMAWGYFGGQAPGRDLVVANPLTGTLTILQRDLEMLYDPIQVPVGGTPVLVAVGDLDGDERDDIVVGDASGTVQTFFGDGTGGLTPGGSVTPGVAPTALVLYDLVGDSSPDVIVGGPGGIAILTNDGDGAFQQTHLLAVNGTVSAIELADIDGNDQRDILASTSGPGGVSLFWGLSGGLYIGPFVFSQGIGDLSGIALAHLDEDGLIDYAVVSPDTGDICIFLQQTPPPLNLNGLPVDHEGRLLSNEPVAVFTDQLSPLPFLEYSATIDWGDGQPPSAGTFQSGIEGEILVLGSHQYQQTGEYFAKVILTHVGGRFSTTTLDVNITETQLTISGIDVSGFAQQQLLNVPVALISELAGIPPSGDLRRFTETTGPASFIASINWGDGTTSPGNISGSSGQFLVTGTHTYAASGSYPITVTVDVAGRTPLVANSTARIVDRLIGTPVTFGGFSSVPLQDVPVGFFSDTLANTVPADYTATIDWGDAQPSTAGQIVAVGNAFQVNGSHTYAQPGFYPVGVRIQHIASGRQTVIPSRADIALGTLDAVGRDIAGIATVTLTDVVVARISDAFASAAQFTATINWGDGSQSPGSVVPSGGGVFEVRGIHTYATAGSFNLSVHITHTDGRSSTTASIAQIASNALVATAVPIHATAGEPLGSVLAGVFFDPVPTSTAANFTVSIAWGDGSAPTAGTVQAVGEGVFNILGSHNYLNPGLLSTAIQITHTDGRTASAAGVASVLDGPISAFGIDVDGIQTLPLANVPVAGFTVFDDAAVAGQFTATIDWGDSTQSAGTIVQLAPGVFQVQGSHTYALAGEFPIAVSILAQDGRTASASSTAFMDENTIIATGGAFSAAAGVAVVDVPVASFIDPIPSAPGNYTVSIVWGDGSAPSAGTVTPSGGGFIVTGTHTYAAGGIFTVNILITHNDGRSASATTVADVQAGELITTGFNFAGQTLVPFSGTVATVLDMQGGSVAGDFTATIDWRDNTPPTAGTVSLISGSTFAIDAAHTYTQAGLYQITVLIEHADGRSATAHSDIVIVDPVLTASGVDLAAVAGVPLVNVIVATFDDDKLTSVVGDFSASIDWGDGTITSGTVLALGGGAFVVRGSHTYQDAFVGSVSIVIDHTDGRSATATSPIVVGLPALSGQGLSINAAVGVDTGLVNVATFSDAKPLSAAGDFTATINWGDGSSSSGIVTAGAAGQFFVSGSHTYAQAGGFTITVSIANTVDSRVLVVQGQATVVQRPLTTNAINVAAVTGIAARQVRVASFRDPLGGTSPGDFAALIDWGDGTSSAGTISVNPNGTFIVRGSNTYARPGQFVVRVQIRQGQELRGATQSVARVVRAAKIALPRPLSPLVNRPLRGVVFAFQDANPLARPQDYTARINWGDGSSSDGRIRLRGETFEVLAQHTYGRRGAFTIVFSIIDEAGVGFSFRQRITVR